MTRGARAWVVLGLTSLALFGNYYIYDSIGPVADLLQRQLGFSDTQIGTLNAIYSLPNIVLVFVGGVLVDRYGPAVVTAWTAAICALGALCTALGESFAVMAAGRLIFGIGAETMIVATLAAIGVWFGAYRLALAMALTVSVARAGSYTVDVSPLWAPGAYESWDGPLWLAAITGVMSLLAACAYWLIERRAIERGEIALAPSASKFVARELLRFDRRYWYVLALCVLFYSVIFPFRSTFAIKYLQHAHEMTLEAASLQNSYVFLVAVFATPLFGWFTDRVGRHGALLTIGAAALPLAFVILAFTTWPVAISTLLIGLSFSLVPAVLWPAVAAIVPAARLGTAYGFMTMLQNVGLTICNVAAGALNDAYGASAGNPAGYLPMIVGFGTLSTLAFLFAVALGLRERGGRRRPLSRT